MTTRGSEWTRRDALLGALAAGGAAALPGCAAARPEPARGPDPIEERTGASKLGSSARQTIGVLGLGAQATLAFEAQVHAAAQRCLPPQATSGYPPMVVHHHRRPPIVVHDDFSPVIPLRADPELLDAARWLATRADFLVVTSNGAHELQAEIEAASGRPLESMIEATLGEVRRRGWRRVGVLAFFDPNAPIYTRRMRELGIAWETIDAALQERLNEAIFRCMEGRDDESSRAAAIGAIAALRERGVDGIVPGCTEIPILLQEDARAPDLVDPSALLAEAAVRRSLAR